MANIQIFVTFIVALALEFVRSQQYSGGVQLPVKTPYNSNPYGNQGQIINTGKGVSPNLPNYENPKREQYGKPNSYGIGGADKYQGGLGAEYNVQVPYGGPTIGYHQNENVHKLGLPNIAKNIVEKLPIGHSSINLPHFFGQPIGSTVYELGQDIIKSNPHLVQVLIPDGGYVGYDNPNYGHENPSQYYPPNVQIGGNQGYGFGFRPQNYGKHEHHPPPPPFHEPPKHHGHHSPGGYGGGFGGPSDIEYHNNDGLDIFESLQYKLSDLLKNFNFSRKHLRSLKKGTIIQKLLDILYRFKDKILSKLDFH